MERSFASSGFLRSTYSPEIAPPSWKSRCCSVCRECCTLLRSRKLVTVEPVLFLYVFAMYLYLVIFELYSFNTYGKETLKEKRINDSISYCLSTQFLDNISNDTGTGDDVEDKTAFLNLIVGITGQLPSIFAVLLLGPLSDQFGRKPALIVVLLGSCVQAALSIVIIRFDLDLRFFLLSSGIKAASGGIAGILTASYSYIADVSSRKWLTLRYGILEAMTYIAGTASLVIGGEWIQNSRCDFLPPSWLHFACIVALVPYVLLLVPESLSKDDRTRRSSKLHTGPKSLLKGLQIFFGKRYSRWRLWFTLLAMMIVILNSSGAVVIITLFLLHDPLEWEPYLIGIYLSLNEFVHGLSVLIFLPVLVICGVPDPLIALLGIGLSCAMNVCMGFVVETWQMFLVGTIQGVDSIVTPALKAIMSKLVAPEDQGALFSFITAAQVLASVLGAVLYATSYSIVLRMNWDVGEPFFLMAILYTFTIPFMIIVLLFERKDNPPQRPLTAIQPAPSGHSINASGMVVTPSINSSGVGSQSGDEEESERQSLLSEASQEYPRSYNSSDFSYQSKNSFGGGLTSSFRSRPDTQWLLM